MAATTFCFTDVAGSTRLARALGDAAFIDVLERHRVLVRAALAAAGGHEVLVEGDGFFLAFDDAAAALRFAVDAQRALAAEPWPAGAEVRVRMGLHRGVAERRPDGDYLGLAVHQAARVGAVGHGGQVVLTAAALEGAGLPDGCRARSLGHHRVRDFAAPVELLQLAGDGLPDGFSPLRADRDAAGLPLPATALLGRDEEVDQVLDRLAAAALVTLVGPGGVGKTRVALEVAAVAAAEHPGGVHLVELSSLDGPDQVLATVAGAIGARALPGTALDDVVVATLAGPPHLVVLDSCERVLDGVASLVDLLARRSPRTTLLATSIEAVRLPGERVVPIGPLAADGPDPLASPAVRLLVDRAEALGARLDLAVDGTRLVELARRLDGIPLALELAGARTAELGPAEALAGLDDRFAALTAGYRTALPRHRTLEAAVAWSVDLLKEDDRALLARLARLRGRWAVPAALDAAGGDAQALERLVDRSLVVLEDGRVRLLDTIRAFAARELDEAGALAVDHRRVRRLADDIRAMGDGPEVPLVAQLRHAAADIADLLPRWVDVDVDAATDLAVTCVPWWEWTAGGREGAEVLRRCAEGGADPARRAMALAGEAQLLALVGEADASAARAAEVLAAEGAPDQARAIGLMFARPLMAPVPEGEQDPLEEADRLVEARDGSLLQAVRSRIALRAALSGRLDEAIDRLQELAVVARRRGYATHEAQALLNRGGFLARAGRLEEAEADLAAGDAVAAGIGLVGLRAAALTNRAAIALQRGDPASALRLAEERLALADETGDARAVAPALSVVSTAAMLLGDLDRAAWAGERTLEAARRTGALEGTTVGAFNLAMLAGRRGDEAAEGRWAAEAYAAGREVGASLERLGTAVVAGVACRRGDLDGARLLGALGDLGGDHHLDPSDRAWLADAVARAEELAGAGAVDAARDEGAAAAWDDARDLAQAVAARLGAPVR